MYWNGQVLRESCELMRAEHERQRTAEAAADCSREDCLRRREHAKMLQETVVELMRKQRGQIILCGLKFVLFFFTKYIYSYIVQHMTRSEKVKICYIL